jgi:hypothetical protein
VAPPNWGVEGGVPEELVRYNKCIFIGIFLWRRRARMSPAEVALMRPEDVMRCGVTMEVVNPLSHLFPQILRGDLVAVDAFRHHTDGLFWPEVIMVIFEPRYEEGETDGDRLLRVLELNPRSSPIQSITWATIEDFQCDWNIRNPSTPLNPEFFFFPQRD